MPYAAQGQQQPGAGGARLDEHGLDQPARGQVAHAALEALPGQHVGHGQPLLEAALPARRTGQHALAPGGSVQSVLHRWHPSARPTRAKCMQPRFAALCMRSSPRLVASTRGAAENAE